MIITRSPLRISLGGGGTDLPSYYIENGGFLIAAAIDKYVYVTINKPFKDGISLKYSHIENVLDVNKVVHPIIRESLKLFPAFNSGQKIEITTLADIPAGTGLGSSGSFTTALLKGLYFYERKSIEPNILAELACDVEINKLGEPIGKQDQYIAAVGGITCFTFCNDGKVTIEPLKISDDTLFDLEDNLLLFFTGFSRAAGSILKDQKEKSQKYDTEMIANLHFVKEMGCRSKKMLEEGKTAEFGALMHQHWEHKKKRSDGMSNTKIDEWYKLGLKNGAVGGKLVGAGGGGFLLFYAEDRNKLRHAMKHAGLEEIRFKFDYEGTKVILS
jgi:D-glycero-alpha-D-manno-heptose-7-phosphate kinase